MHTKQSITLRLRRLLELVESSETDADARRAIRRSRDPDLLWDDHIEHRLWRIERELRVLADRPAGRCQFSEGDSSRVIDFMTGRGPSERAKGIQYLSQWLGTPQKLTIADTYFLKNSGVISEGDYTASLGSLLPKSIETLELFVGPQTNIFRKQAVAVWLNDYCGQRGIALSVFNQKEIHDRVWIADHDRALVVGASFNGIGNKCAFLLPLDQSDTASFNVEIQRIRNSVIAKNQA